MTTGWARPDGRCGAFTVRGIGDHGQALALFSDWIDGELDREPLVYLAVERGYGGANAVGRLTTAMEGTAHAAAWSRCIPRTDRPPNQVRKWLLGFAAPPGATRRERVRRLDAAVLAAVRARGFCPACEHAADAAALLCMTEGRGMDWLARAAGAGAAGTPPLPASTAADPLARTLDDAAPPERYSAQRDLGEAGEKALPADLPHATLTARAREFLRGMRGRGEQMTNEASGITVGYDGTSTTKSIARRGPDLLRLVPVIPDVVRHGEYLGERPGDERHPHVLAMHSFGARMSLDGRPFDLVVQARQLRTAASSTASISTGRR